MLALEVLGLRKLFIIIGLDFDARPQVQVVANVQCETALYPTAAKPYRLLVCVHVLLSVALPLVNVWLVPVLKTV